MIAGAAAEGHPCIPMCSPGDYPAVIMPTEPQDPVRARRNGAENIVIVNNIQLTGERDGIYRIGITQSGQKVGIQEGVFETASRHGQELAMILSCESPEKVASILEKLKLYAGDNPIYDYAAMEFVAVVYRNDCEVLNDFSLLRLYARLIARRTLDVLSARSN